MSDDEDGPLGHSLRAYVADLLDCEVSEVRSVRYTWPADGSETVIEVGLAEEVDLPPGAPDLTVN